MNRTPVKFEKLVNPRGKKSYCFLDNKYAIIDVISEHGLRLAYSRQSFPFLSFRQLSGHIDNVPESQEKKSRTDKQQSTI